MRMEIAVDTGYTCISLRSMPATDYIPLPEWHTAYKRWPRIPNLVFNDTRKKQGDYPFFIVAQRKRN